MAKANPKGKDSEVWKRFADECLDWLFCNSGKDFRQHVSAAEFAADWSLPYTEVTRLLVENAELKEALALSRPEWQPIETAPKDGTLILGKRRYPGWPMEETAVVSWDATHFGGSWLLNVTGDHAETSEWCPDVWMPLPLRASAGAAK